MYFSLKAKTFLLIFVTMASTAIAVIYFSDRDITQAIMASEEASAQNIIQLVDLNVKQAYSQLLNNRITSMQQHKAILKNHANIADSVLAKYQQLVATGKLTEAQARSGTLDWLRSVEQIGGYQWFVINQEADILAHSEEGFEGASVAAMSDIKGRALVPLLYDVKSNYLVDYAVFYWNSEEIADKGKKLGYFKSIPRWGWTLTTMVNLQDLEAETEARKNSVLESLKNTFTNIRIAQTGTTFLFDGSGQTLIPPTGPLRTDFLTTTNTATGNSVFKDLMTMPETGAPNLACSLPHKNDEETAYKIYLSYFKPFDWYLAAAIPMAEITLPARQITARQKQLIALIFLASLVVAYIFVSRISKPLKQLATFAKQMPGHNFSSPMATAPIFSALATGRNDEVGRLAQAFAFMVQELEDNIHQLMEVSAARERMAEELNIARKIQMGILPKTFPAFPSRSDFDLFALLYPAKEVGGDLYDFFLIDDRKLCFTLGDVSDKGIPAALFMVITRTLVKNTAQHFDSTADIMERVNAILSSDNPNTMFVTLIIGILDLHTGEIRYANGGHNPPIHIKRNREFTFLKEISGPVVGALEGLKYQELSLTLDIGDTLFLYTDGVTEAMNEERVKFGDGQLLESLQKCPSPNPETILHHVMSCIEDHVGAAPQSDDIAMLAICYKPELLN